MNLQNKWQHKCFESSFTAMKHLIELGYEPYIVQGKYLVENKLIAHSWVELNDKGFSHQIYDLTTSESTWIEKKDFYSYWNVKDICIYSRKEVEYYLQNKILMLGSTSFFKDCYFH